MKYFKNAILALAVAAGATCTNIANSCGNSVPPPTRENPATFYIKNNHGALEYSNASIEYDSSGKYVLINNRRRGTIAGTGDEGETVTYTARCPQGAGDMWQIVSKLCSSDENIPLKFGGSAARMPDKKQILLVNKFCSDMVNQ